MTWAARTIAVGVFTLHSHAALANEISASSFLVRLGTFSGTLSHFRAAQDQVDLKLYSNSRARLNAEFSFNLGSSVTDIKVLSRFNQTNARNTFVFQARNQSGSWIEIGRTSGSGYRSLSFSLASNLIVNGVATVRIVGGDRFVDDVMVDYLALMAGSKVIAPAPAPAPEPTPIVSEPAPAPAPEPAPIVSEPAPAPAPEPAPIVSEPAPAPAVTEVTRAFAAHSNLIPNPERGFHHWMTMSSSQSAFNNVRAQGDTLGIFVVRMDEFRTSSLSSVFISNFERQLGYARTAGIKLTLKFSYNEGPYPNSMPDASEAQILAHIAQLKPAIQRNADVIAFVQAGFIGAWGEWHTSTNQLLDFSRYPNAARNILLAVLDALPQGRFAQLRYPRHKVHFFGSTNISSAEAFGSTAKARVGHHNDCFLANATDHGTYTPMNYSTSEVEKWKNFIGADGQFAPVGGETCEASSFSTCENALYELRRQRYTYLNLAYHPTVISEWRNRGCFDQIKRHLGYRLELIDVKHSQGVSAGGQLSLSVRLNNSGFASIMNPRPVFLVLEGANGSRHNIALTGIDPRRWGQGQSSFTTAVTLPSNIAAGRYRMSLWLPDGAATLRDNALFAVQFANTGVWDSSKGLNVIATDFEVK